MSIRIERKVNLPALPADKRHVSKEERPLFSAEGLMAMPDIDDIADKKLQDALSKFLSKDISPDISAPIDFETVSLDIEVTSADETPKPSCFDEETRQKLDNKLGEGFTVKLEQTAKNINCNPEDLLAILCVESVLNPAAVYSGHYGLLQISSGRLKSYGTTGEEFIKKDALQQLDYVEKYFTDKDINPKGKFLSLGDLYAKVFLPGRSKNEILCRKSEEYYRKNSGLDFDKNGNISKTDLQNKAKWKMKHVLAGL